MAGNPERDEIRAFAESASEHREIDVLRDRDGDRLIAQYMHNSAGNGAGEA